METEEASMAKGVPEDEGTKKSNYRARNNKSKSKSHTGKSTTPDRGVVTNDPAYYAKYPELLEGSAHLNYSEPYGKLVKYQETNVHGVRITGDTNLSSCRSVPGVLSVMTKPTYGYSDNAKSALNVAAATMYVNLRQKVSGRKNYEAPDVFMYEAAIAELYSAVNWASRFYALGFEMSQTNQFISSGLAKAMRVNLDDIRRNLANFRYWLNSFIEKVSCYAIPQGITFFDKKVDEYTYIYIENNDKNIKDQLYVKIPEGFHKFILDAQGAGMLSFVPINYTNDLTTSDIITVCESLLSDIWNDEDFALISGDILKTYEGRIIGLTNIPSEVQLNIVYDELFLLQLKNSTPVANMDASALGGYMITGAAGSTMSCKPGNVYQDNKGILHARNEVEIITDISASTPNLVNVGLLQDKIIDQKSPNPGLYDNIESSRMMVSVVGEASHGQTAGHASYWLYCSAYVVTGLDIIVMENNGQYRMGNPVAFAMPRGNVQTVASWMSAGAVQRFMLTFFKYFPNLRLVAVNTSSSDNYCAYMYFLTNLDNFTWVPKDTLDKMHDCAWLSMLAVEGVAKVKNTLV